MPRNGHEKGLAQKVRESWQRHLTGRVGPRPTNSQAVVSAGSADYQTWESSEVEPAQENADLESILKQWQEEFEAAVAFLNEQLKRIFLPVKSLLPHELDDKVYEAVEAKSAVLRQLYASAAARIRTMVAEQIRLSVERESYPDTLEYLEGIHKQELEHARLAGQVP